jgi:hypothetical protein
MAVYADSFKYEVCISGSWIDITNDVVDDSSCGYGIEGSQPKDRTASGGEMVFYLNNKTNLYNPSSGVSLAGFTSGIPFRFSVWYEGVPSYRFYGRITGLDPDSRSTGILPKVKVTCDDWLDFATNQKVINPTIAYNKRIDEAVPLLLAGLPIQPVKTLFFTGEDTMATVFDQTKANSKVLSELNKLNLSEFGFAYLTHNNDLETLVIEGRKKRNYDTTADRIPVSKGYSPLLLTESGIPLLAEDGTNLLVNVLQDMVFSNNMTDLKVNFGQNDVANSIIVKAYPRKIDLTPVVLFTLASPLAIKTLEVKTLTGTYKDPLGLASQTNGKDMIQPVKNTDYQLNSNSSFTGIDLTDYLTVTAQYSSNQVIYTLTNTSNLDAYINLQSRGTGIYSYNPIEFDQEDTTSELAYGYKELTVDQTYQSDSSKSALLASALLSQNKDPKQKIESLSFIANVDIFSFLAFLYLNVGDLVQIIESQSGVNGLYYIQKIEFTIIGKIIYMTIYPIEKTTFSF